MSTEHRYALRIGRTRGERTQVVIGMSSGRYPILARQLAPSAAP